LGRIRATKFFSELRDQLIAKRLPEDQANMGTSVEMLEDFYGKKRMRDPKMATELTKDRRRERIT
jgi:hypothetical protein